MNTLDVNSTTIRNAYPTGYGYKLSQMATGRTGRTVGGNNRIVGNTNPPNTNVQSGGEVEDALNVGMSGSLAIGMLALFVLTFGVMFLAKYLGTDEDFKSLKPSFYNVIIISLAATAGMPLWKWLFVKVKVPGVSAWVLSA